MKRIFNRFSHLWNDLSTSERTRLHPYSAESQLMHIEQCKLKIIASHNKLINELNEQQDYIERELNKIAEEQKQ